MQGDTKIVQIPGKGRGTIALRSFEPGELIESAPVIITTHVPDEGEPGVEHPTDEYVFNWGSDRSAIACGHMSFCNHSDEPNCRYEENHMDKTMNLIALRHIAQLEELTIDYKCELWFSPA